MADLSRLLDQLTIRDDQKSGKGLADELDKTEFSIFEPLADLGYFAWKPNNAPYQPLSSLKSADEIRRHVDVDGKPDRLVPVSSLRLPKGFAHTKDRKYRNQFPYGELDVACLYVAVKHRGLDLDKVDFAFGGSTLEMLANKDAGSPYIVVRVPGFKTILVVKRKEYDQNLADIGFQFERYVTGKSMSDVDAEVEFVEHMHLMNVGKYNVLFRAETDARQADSPVEVKVSNPQYWGTKVMFQMISSGSTKLCHGEKTRGALTNVTLKSLSRVARDSLAYSDVASLQKNILDGMEAIQEQLRDGEVRKVSFSGGQLRLIHTSGRTSDVLPSGDVVRSLLGS
jgi:hypothetical protein